MSGSKKAGIEGTKSNEVLNTSTVPAAKLVAYRRVVPSVSVAMASPLYAAPGGLAAMIAYLPAFAGSNPTGFTFGFHPTIVPSSVAKRKEAGAVTGRFPVVTPEILKAPCPFAVLKTRPVGVPLAPSGSPGLGIE